ncbi:MAG TPA: class I SAM-dependent methyltransferase [Dehalococcoidales bacterium]|nr:class I SAM-dependent methyltransferase [Dehalococcoidales bacterium]
MADYSARFYENHARRYSEVTHALLQSVYIKSSHPAVRTDLDLLKRLKELVPGKRGLDAGCGAGARDVYSFWASGFDIHGIDVVKENIRTAQELHPEITDRVTVADLAKPLPYDDASFDFVMCNAVIQHIPPEVVERTTLPELARVIRKGGILQLIFKNGAGIMTIYDRDYSAERSFQLYDEHRVLAILKRHNMELVEESSREKPGGIMYFTDPKPVDHCVFYARKMS